MTILKTYGTIQYDKVASVSEASYICESRFLIILQKFIKSEKGDHKYFFEMMVTYEGSKKNKRNNR